MGEADYKPSSRFEKALWTTVGILTAYIAITSHFDSPPSEGEHPITDEAKARHALEAVQRQGGLVVLLGGVECPVLEHDSLESTSSTVDNYPVDSQQFSAHGVTIKVQEQGYDSPNIGVGKIYCGQLATPNTVSTSMPNAIIAEGYVGAP